MDYIDWCLQAYITTVTPITYSAGFHQMVSTFLYTVLTFESIEAFQTFVQNAVLYNGQNFIQAAYTRVVVVILNNYISLLYNTFNGISFLQPGAVIIFQFWSIYFYLMRSTLAAYTKQDITFYPQYKFPCECSTTDCDECKV